MTGPAGPTHPPTYATVRNPALRTRGGRVPVLLKALSYDALPWQRYVSAVAGEVNPPGSRLYWRYQTVVVSVPRQAGKTTLAEGELLERALSTPRLEARMTAQRGKDASDRWRDLADDIEASVLASGASILRGNGRQIIELPNRSRIRPFAPTRDGLHGSSPHFVLIDEAWSFTEERGEQLMAAVDPAQVTHRDRQTWIISAAGDLTSVWWNELCNKGRAATEDKASTIAYFEWSMRAGADPYNPASWGFHPGLDGLISVDDLAAAAQTNSLGNFLRSYMNTRTSTRDAIIPMDAWNAAPKPARPSAAAIVYGYAAAIDRSHASIYGAWRDASDRLCLHVYKTAEGIDWLVPTLTELAGKGAALVADDGGFTRVITDQLQRASVPVQTLAGRDQGTAWAAFKQSALSVHHDHSQALTEALSVAQEAPRGDHYIVSRRHSLGAIDALEAAYVGLWFVDRLRPPLVIY